ncbi:ribosomal protein S18-alanine N-acetyltransferase [Actinoallomurus sp. NBC_01490]|jgi:ribosomal-protein-alanine N-acetyltransferase|uniref:ribosomal protein S18-alanine N-acetyltransferase n=1 Tax=Actinoallomurus sp. NBC_01490 TaxID=2903557 RepID=UPI002E305C5D|nr:ribosomal protein S18-alanine N-acetyltransferase [Actinoallomurus sp. NBC_01490]
MKVRELTLDDLPAVLELEHLLFTDEAWSEKTYRGELVDRSGTRHYVAVDDGGVLAGWAGLSAVGGQGDVLTIGVRPELQGRGIGSALLTALLEEAAVRGCVEIFLDVRADNDRARRLYERFGFTAVGIRKRYYQPSGVDAIVMVKQSRPADAPARQGVGT